MRDMGNSRARAIYEARLPDNFKRPQSDSALETFIRSKYEQKRYIATEYTPSKPDIESLMMEIHKLEQGNKKRPNASSMTLTQLPPMPIDKPTTMRDMGNSRARAIYEARLPDNFKRPQSDSALETFIRSKYEQKRYIATEYTPSKPDIESLMMEIHKLEQGNKKRPNASSMTLTQLPPMPIDKPTKTMHSHPKSTEADLLGLEVASESTTKPEPSGDLFAQLATTQTNDTSFAELTNNTPNSTNLSADLFGLDMSGAAPVAAQQNCFTQSAITTDAMGTAASNAAGKTSKDAILALYQQQKPTQSTNSMPFPISQAPPSYAESTAGFGQFSTSDWPVPNTKSSLNRPDKAWSTFDDLQPMESKQAAPAANFPQQGMPPNPGFAYQQPSNMTQAPTGVPNAQAFTPFTPVSSTPSNFASWPQTEGQWGSHTANTTAAAANTTSSALFQTAFPPTNQGHMPFQQGGFPVPSWNGTSRSPPTAVAPQPFADGQGFGPGMYNTSSVNAAHQAYLSQVQSQLASLQFSGTVNNPQ